MQGREPFAARRRLSEQLGTALFEDAALADELRFRNGGATIVDHGLTWPLEYFYPSAIGSACFFEGGFESGEIAVASGLLAALSPIVLDIGANIGTHTVAWASIPGATCHAFEPVPAARGVLERNVVLNNLSAHVAVSPLAMGRAVGTAALYECADAAYSTLLPKALAPVAGTYEVPVTTIDAYVAAARLPRVDLIKIDVEGYEDAVLEGGRDTIAAMQPLLFVEISRVSGATDPDAVIAEILKRDYSAFVINDGIVTPFVSHDDDAYNYLFVPPRFMSAIRNASALGSARETMLYRAHVIHVQERALNHLRGELDDKDSEIDHLKAAADERLAVVDRLDRDLRSALAALADLEVRLHAAEEVGADVVALEATSRELRERLADAQVEIATRNAVVEKLEEIARRSQGASEDLRRVADERLRAIEQITKLADERLSVIRALHEQRREP